MKGCKFVDDEDVIHTPTGWLRTNIKNSCAMESELWKNARSSAFLLDGTMLCSNKLACALCIFY